MNDLISRESVKRLTTKRNNIWNEVTDAEGRGLDEILDSIPSIDAVPVKHGRWIPIGEVDADGNQYYYCSECLHGETHVPIVQVGFCWNCGARMDGEE